MAYPDLELRREEGGGGLLLLALPAFLPSAIFFFFFFLKIRRDPGPPGISLRSASAF